MKKLTILLLVLSSLNCAFGQENSNTYSKWYLKPAAGINIPITNLLSGEITDNLFEYDDNSYYWQVISANYFFSSKWGIELTYQAGYSQNISGRADRFNTELEEKYGDDYFVSPSSGAQYDNFTIIGGSIQRGYLGLVYRIEKPKYIILPKVSIGVTSFYTDWGRADLKEKGTNTVYKLSYDSGERPNDHFTLAPSITFGYRLSKRLIANIDVLYSYYKTDIEFTEEIRNTFTEEISFRTIDYKKNMHTLTIGLGLIIELKPAVNK
jgi:outer membrane protein W